MSEDFYPPMINRAVVMVIPKKPYYDWNKAVFPGLSGMGSKNEFNSYLVADTILPAEPKKALNKHWEWIFENELFSVCTDEDTWPENRTWKLFNEWFEVRFSTVVMDLVERPIQKED